MILFFMIRLELNFINVIDYWSREDKSGIVGERREIMDHGNTHGRWLLRNINMKTKFIRDR